MTSPPPGGLTQSNHLPHLLPSPPLHAKIKNSAKFRESLGVKTMCLGSVFLSERFMWEQPKRRHRLMTAVRRLHQWARLQQGNQRSRLQIRASICRASCTQFLSENASFFQRASESGKLSIPCRPRPLTSPVCSYSLLCLGGKMSVVGNSPLCDLLQDFIFKSGTKGAQFYTD